MVLIARKLWDKLSAQDENVFLSSCVEVSSFSGKETQGGMKFKLSRMKQNDRCRRERFILTF